MTTQAADIDVDSIIQRLLEVRGSRPGRQVQLTENEIKGLCIKAREIFMSQPILLELEAPIKICGKYLKMVALFNYLLFITNVCSKTRFYHFYERWLDVSWNKFLIFLFLLTLLAKVISTGSIMIFYDYLSMEVFHQRPIICFLEITLIAANRA